MALVLLLALSPVKARAWDNQGHMANGEAAYDILSRRDPGAVRAILDLAAALPRRERMDAALSGLAGPARDRMIFAYLARWPDDIRGSAFDYPVRHYRVRIVSDIGAILPLRGGEADSACAAYLKTLRNHAAGAPDRAIAMAWLFHIVGDMHQPLHAATWWSWTFPKTDRIGSIAYVRRPSGKTVINLHQVWDEAADRPGADAAGAAAIADVLARSYPRERLPELRARSDDFNVWADESAALARRVAYADGDLVTGASPATAPILSAKYLDKARQSAERRLAVASWRLADILEGAVR